MTLIGYEFFINGYIASLREESKSKRCHTQFLNQKTEYDSLGDVDEEKELINMIPIHSVFKYF